MQNNVTIEELSKIFGFFNEEFKKYQEGVSFDDLRATNVAFSVDLLQMKDLTSLESIAADQSTVARMLFIYGSVYESQNMVLQKLEDEFKLWEAKIYNTISSDKSFKTEGARNNYLYEQYKNNYEIYNSKLRAEKYKLGILKRTISSLETYSYKLDSVQRSIETAIKKMA